MRVATAVIGTRARTGTIFLLLLILLLRSIRISYQVLLLSLLLLQATHSCIRSTAYSIQRG